MTYVRTKTGRKVTGFTFLWTAAISCLIVQPRNKLRWKHFHQKRPSWSFGKMVNRLTTLCGSNEEFLRRMDYAIELTRTRKVKNVPAFLYKAIAENYLQQDKDMQAAIEHEFQAKQENAAWELDAIKMFGDAISLDVEETPFDLSDEMERAMVSVVKRHSRNAISTSQQNACLKPTACLLLALLLSIAKMKHTHQMTNLYWFDKFPEGDVS